MARRLRIQYSDAIYHVMARGNGRQDIVQDDADRGRLVACLERAVRRSGWSLYAFVFLTNHLHLVLKTPRPNLAKGMQLFLSSYANGWARRHRHCGHLFQGRYRTELVEDETYLCGSAGSAAPRGQTEFRVNSKLGLTPGARGAPDPRRPRPQAPPAGLSPASPTALWAAGHRISRHRISPRLIAW